MSDTRTYIVPDGQENSTNQRRRGGMRDSDYDDEDYPRYY